MSENKKWPVAVDPRGCGCTECMVGEYVPLEYASIKQVRKAAKGKLRNNTGYPDDLLLEMVKAAENSHTI